MKNISAKIWTILFPVIFTLIIGWIFQSLFIYGKVECALFCIYYIVAMEIVWTICKNTKSVYFFVIKQWFVAMYSEEYRTAYPCRYSDMTPYFGRSVPELSMITNAVVVYIYDNHGHRVTEWNDQILSPSALKTYADAIRMKGAALGNCFDFVDGTVQCVQYVDQNKIKGLSTMGIRKCMPLSSNQ